MRLIGWDYSSDAHYCVTICTKNKRYYFGKIVDGEMRLSTLGMVAHQCWLNILSHFPHVDIDEFIIMPNHVHGIIIIKNPVETQNFVSLQQNKHLKEMQNVAPLQQNNDSNEAQDVAPQSKNSNSKETQNFASLQQH